VQKEGEREGNLVVGREVGHRAEEVCWKVSGGLERYSKKVENESE
jgi:hypothetical protein